ncbi:MAG: AMP-binding protein [Thiocapsa sp.]|uniref:AMP-binding protein n=1 Tax=Thiocapsa sp. TaxID=2024551 RepID=UPI001BD02668|nr:AMP-binding protein [Thiocapsa sp.]QVL50125.1 MAG: AMP-binding protein [Thiocapsa sp.]
MAHASCPSFGWDACHREPVAPGFRTRMYWSLNEVDPDAVAVLGGHDSIDGWALSYRELTDSADAFAASLDGGSAKELGAIFCRNSPQAIAAYLGALRHGDAVMLLNARMDAGHLEALMRAYRPDWVYEPRERHSQLGKGRVREQWGWRLWQPRASRIEEAIHADLALLLSTSGTTGSPRMVRLSQTNLASNAAAIVAALGIDAEDRALAALPMHYAYGLSVLNSHLHAGAALVVTEESPVEAGFWQTVAGRQVTTLPGVPMTYQMLMRLNPGPRALASVRSLTVAGGPLAEHLVERMADWCDASGARFHVMYGQTEATARMSVLPPGMLRSKPGSVGLAIGAGRLSLSPGGELLFAGPNVMMGYALAREDLALGDCMGGRLATGDLGRIDDDGCAYVSGRLKRMLKIHGHRVSLDVLEQGLETLLRLPVAVAGEDDRLVVYLEAGSAKAVGSARDALTRRYRLPPSAFEVQVLSELPRTINGKLDAAALRALDSGTAEERRRG